VHAEAPRTDLAPERFGGGAVVQRYLKPGSTVVFALPPKSPAGRGHQPGSVVRGR